MRGRLGCFAPIRPPPPGDVVIYPPVIGFSFVRDLNKASPYLSAEKLRCLKHRAFVIPPPGWIDVQITMTTPLNSTISEVSYNQVVVRSNSDDHHHPSDKNVMKNNTRHDTSSKYICMMYSTAILYYRRTSTFNPSIQKFWPVAILLLKVVDTCLLPKAKKIK